MKKFSVVLGVLVLSGCFYIVDQPGGGVALRVAAPTIAVAAPRLVAVSGVAGVYYSPTDPNLLWHSGRWYRYYNGSWHYRTAWGGAWVVTAGVPSVFLRIPRTLPVFGRIVVHHPHYKKPVPVAKPRVVKPLRGTVRPAPKVVRPARPFKPPVVKPPVVKPGKPPKKPKKEKEKEKDPKGKAWGIRR